MSFEANLPPLLAERGFEIEPIARSSGKSPDFLLNDGPNTYLIELKEKFFPEETVAAREAALDAGQMAEEEHALGHTNTVSGVISDAVQQLTSQDAPASDCRIVWLHAQSHLPKVQIEHFRATLYGIATVVDWGPEEGFAGDCYYFGESEFWRHRASLDGAVLSFVSAGEVRAFLCINDHSQNYGRLCVSPFRDFFGVGVIDPNSIASSRSELVIRAPIDRRDQNAVLAFLISQHGMEMPHVMPMKQYTATVAVPGDDA